MRTLFRLVATIVVAALGLTAVGAAVVPEVVRFVTANEMVAAQLPPFEPLSQRSLMYDTDGNIIDILKIENREPFPLADVPPLVKEAILAVEDEAFYRHRGVNGKSLMRALLANVAAGEVTQGGSTITQQVVKNSFLTSERATRRKLLEAAYAVQLEKEYTKDEILERYLNTVYLGNNAYGLEAAAETYFGKSVSQLTMVEGAFLAGLIRNPEGYNPFFRPDRSRTRFRQVLDRLVAVELITQAEADRLGENWKLPEQRQRPAEQISARTYFSDEVKDILLNKSSILGDDYQERYDRLFRGGLRIYTTLDPTLQYKAELAKAITVPSTGGRFEAAMTAIETRTGAVRAMVGGPGFETSQVNLALARRQTGSSIKIFILAAALQAGVQPNDLIDGTRPCILPNPDNPKEPFAITGGVSEPVGPLERMTTLSINCAYARLSQIVGLHRVVDTAQRLGVTSPLFPYASFATGANEVTTLDMATGMATLANRGVRNDPYYLERIEGPDGEVIYQHQAAPVPVVDEGVALSAIETLRGPLLRGTGRRGRLAGDRPAAGKTGTQDDNTNATFVGSTPQYTAAVWMGSPTGYVPMVNIPEFKEFPKVQGGTYPVLFWKAFMDAAHDGLPVEDWAKPPKNPRPAARLYLPGTECVARAVGGARPATTTPGSTVPTDPSAPSTTPVTTGPPLQVINPGTTVPANQLDPKAPVPSVPVGYLVYDCRTGPPKPKPPAPKPTVPTSTTSTTVPDTSPPDTSPPTTEG